MFIDSYISLLKENGVDLPTQKENGTEVPGEQEKSIRSLLEALKEKNLEIYSIVTSNIQDVAKLLNYGMQLNDIISIENQVSLTDLLQNNEKVNELIDKGARPDLIVDIIHGEATIDQLVALAEEHPMIFNSIKNSNIGLIIDKGNTFNDIILPVISAEVELEALQCIANNYQVGELIDRVSYKELSALDLNILKIIGEEEKNEPNYTAVLNLIDADVPFRKITELGNKDEDRLKTIIENYKNVVKLVREGVSFDKFAEMEEKKLELLLENSDSMLASVLSRKRKSNSRYEQADADTNPFLKYAKKEETSGIGI